MEFHYGLPLQVRSIPLLHHDGMVAEPYLATAMTITSIILPRWLSYSPVRLFYPLTPSVSVSLAQTGAELFARN